MKLLTTVLLLWLSGVAQATDPSPAASREIASLFATLEQSACQFKRNGAWYTATQATDHLRHKYDYLRRKGLVTTTESFIDRAASRSSLSGKPYWVRCDGQPPEQSASWFTAALARLRRAPDVSAIHEPVTATRWQVSHPPRGSEH